MVNRAEISRKWLLVVGCMTTLTLSAQLIPVNKGGKYGFEKNGVTVIAPQFDYASHFSEGMALVKTNTGWGYIDSLGNWLVKPLYSQATPFRNGYANVFDKGKRGVIGTGGKMVLDAVYDTILDHNDRHYIVKGKLRGFANADYSFVSPVIYTVIDDYYYYDYLSCQKPSGLWDIYSKKGLLMADVDRPLNDNNFLTNTQLMFLKKGGKYGVYGVNKGWIHEPAYDSIFETPFPYYTIGNNYFREIFVLWNKGTDPDPASHRHQFIQIMDGGGTILSKETFYDFDNPRNGVEPLKFIGDEVTLFLYPDLKARHLPYGSVQQHLSWFIAVSGGKAHILDRDFIEIAVFDKAEPVMIRTQMEYYDEMGDFLWDDVVYADQTPFLIVSKIVGEGSQSALYSLEERKVVTPFYAQVEFRPVFDNTTGLSGYVYTNSNGNEGIYLPGMTSGTNAEYLQITLLRDKKMVCTNPKNNQAQLWDLSKKQPTLLLEEYKILESSGFLQEYSYYDSISGEVNYMEPIPQFNEYFFICENEAGKQGILCLNGMRTPCSYDAITQCDNMVNLVNVQVGDRYGIVNVYTGETIPAEATEIIQPDYNAFRESYYVTVYEKNESGEFTDAYYLDQYGRYYVQYLSENTQFFKEKGNIGIKTYSEFDEKEIIAIPAQYKKLEWLYSDSEKGLLMAKGTNGKWGILDFKGDTIAPFIFKEFKKGYFTYNEYGYLLGVNGKKWALYDNTGRTLIPFGTADSWRELLPVEGISGLIGYTFQGKYGVVSYDGKSLLPAVYDDIDVSIPYGADMYGAQKIVQLLQDGKWYAFYANLPPGYEQTGPVKPFKNLELDTTGKFGPYDFIIGDWYFRENGPNDFAIDRLHTFKESVQDHGELPSLSEGNVLLFVENGKIGVRTYVDDETVKTVTVPTFTHTAFYDDYMIIVHDKGQTFYYDFMTKKRFNIETW